MARIAILHILLSILTATYCVSDSRCVLEQAARGASTSPCLHGLVPPSGYAESVHEVNSLQLLQLRGTSRLAPVCGILWFYHIPKTGGQSVKAWLDKMKTLGGFEDVISLVSPVIPPVNPNINFINFTADHINFTAFHEQKIRPLLRNMKGKRVAVHHHHMGPGLYGMDSYFSDMKNTLSSQGCSLIRFTVLREPVAQLFSAVNYHLQINGTDVPNSSERNHVFRYKLFQPRRDNAEVRYILNNFNSSKFPMHMGESHEDALKAAEAILDGFEVVGLLEELAPSIGKVAQLLKLPYVEVPHKNERGASYQKSDDQPLPDDVVALINERTKFDSKLYKRFSGAAVARFSE